MLEIIRRIGEAAPTPIKLSRLIESPEQDFFSYAVAPDKSHASVRAFELLASSCVNIRFISQQVGGAGDLNVRLCVDAEHRDKALTAFRNGELFQDIQGFHHQPGAVILSVYPFAGEPQVSIRVFSTLRSRNIQILSTNSATSVLSCVVLARDRKRAVSSLKEIFVLQ